MSQILQKCANLEDADTLFTDEVGSCIEALALVPFRLPSITVFYVTVRSDNHLNVIRNKLPLPNLLELGLEFDDDHMTNPENLIQILRTTTSLTSLTIRYHHGFDLIVLDSMPNLKDLELCDCNLNDTSCRDLARFVPRLQVLDLAGHIDISLNGMHELGRAMTQLEELTIDYIGPHIANILKNLEYFPNLRSLLFWEFNEEANPNQQQSLQAIRPNLKIEFQL